MRTRQRHKGHLSLEQTRLFYLCGRKLCEQKYHVAYMRNAKAYGRVSKVLEARQKHAKDVAAAHAKDVKNRRKK